MIETNSDSSIGGASGERSAFLLNFYGNVQGVGFRKSVQRAARKTGITGWIRNTNTGYVQAFLEGEALAVRRLICEIQMSECKAELDDMVMSRADPVGADDFLIFNNSNFRDQGLVLASSMVTRSELIAAEFRDLNQYLLAVTSKQNSWTASSRALTDLATNIPARFLGEPLLQRQKRLPYKLTEVVGSFSTEAWTHRIFNHETTKRLSNVPEYIIDNKAQGRRLAKLLGLRTTQIYSHNVQFNDVKIAPPVVIKPLRGAGSKGVFVIRSEDSVFDVAANCYLKGRSALDARASHYMEQSKVSHRWSAEELVECKDGTVPHDLKFYAFYGSVPLILEVRRDESGNAYCWWDSNGRNVQTGKYDNALFTGTGPTPQDIELVKSVSLRIPVPYVRIDFMKGKSGLVFGEFTPKPGRFNEFDAKTDTLLGEAFIRARSRVHLDIANGKKFEEYDKLVAEMNSRNPNQV